MSKTPKSIKARTIIYTLADPFTLEIRYIGKTVSLLHHRLGQHLYVTGKESNHRTNWIKSIINKGGKPIIEYLDESVWNESQILESYWIEQFSHWGFKLVNSTLGGEGNLGRIVSEESKKKMSESQRKKSKKVYQYTLEGEFIREWSGYLEAGETLGLRSTNICQCCNGGKKMHGGYQWKLDYNEKIEKYVYDRVMKEETKLKISRGNKGKPKSDSHVLKLSLKKRKLILNTETGETYSGVKEASLKLNLTTSFLYKTLGKGINPKLKYHTNE